MTFQQMPYATFGSYHGQYLTNKDESHVSLFLIHLVQGKRKGKERSWGKKEKKEDRERKIKLFIVDREVKSMLMSC